MEIVYKLNLDLNQLKVLDNHSVLNVLNVVVYELLLFAQKTGDVSAMDDAIDELKTLADRISAGRFGEEHLGDLITVKNRLLNLVYQKAESGNLLDENAVYEILINLRGIFEILEIRVGEMRERLKDPLAWERFSVRLLEDNLHTFFKAIERNAKGRYRLVYDRNMKTSADYFVGIEMKGPSREEHSVIMPPVFQDVIRDLAANARKYSNPGSDIEIHVIQDAKELLIEVSDTGIGIPEDEIPEILSFGFRASNTDGRSTMGGGFGLTKAFYLVQMFDGKMWIDSKVGASSGTRIRISLPVSDAIREQFSTVSTAVE